LRAALNVANSASLSDAALLLAAFERWHENCTDHIVGDYAFAAWDRTNSKLVLARDPLGCRPLHYFHDRRLLAFASMPRGLHALGEVPREADFDYFANGLMYYTDDASRTAFKNIQQVAMGQMAVFERGALRLQQHWQPSHKFNILRRPSDYHDALREQLDRAVLVRLRGARKACHATERRPRQFRRH